MDLQKSVYGGSAWTYNADRDQCYLHQYLAQQPDLNLRSSRVQRDLEVRYLSYIFENIGLPLLVGIQVFYGALHT